MVNIISINFVMHKDQYFNFYLMMNIHYIIINNLTCLIVFNLVIINSIIDIIMESFNIIIVIIVIVIGFVKFILFIRLVYLL